MTSKILNATLGLMDDNVTNQNLSSPQISEQQNTSANISWLKTLSVGFTLVSFGIAIGIGGYFLATQKNQPIPQNQQISISPTTSQPSPIPIIDETVSGKMHTIGDITFNLPEGWKINKGTYSTQKDKYFTLYSPDITPPFPEGNGIGAVIHLRRQKTELTDTRCDPNEKISDEFERGITSDIKCIKINGKDIKSEHVDYEGHYLIYKFIHKGSTYSFNLQTSGVLKSEEKYLPFLESILNSINFGEN